MLSATNIGGFGTTVYKYEFFFGCKLSKNPSS